MNTEPRKKEKIDFKKDLKFMSNAVFGKTMKILETTKTLNL